jgi:polysaccharide export outer membrane protein
MASTINKPSIPGPWQFGLFAILVCVLSCSCLAQETSASDQGRRQPGNKAVDSARLRIGSGDLLELSVFDVPELAQVVRVSDTGSATLMLLGSLHLDGLTAVEAQALIEYRLRQGNFILDPHVSLIIREYGTQGVSVLGEVKKPGVYQVLGARNLLDIISEAGGTTPFAGQQATVKRRASQETLTASLSNDPAELLARDIELCPGDTVVVPKAGIVYVLGDVGRPGGYVMQNNGRISLLQAIAMAQGVNRTAAKKHTRLIRKSASGVQETTLDLKPVLEGRAPDPALEPEDILYIPPSSAKSFVMRDTPALMQSTASAAIYQAMP